MCGRQILAKFACAGGHETAKLPVFCNDHEKTNILIKKWRHKIKI